jgi:hypothetical protein
MSAAAPFARFVSDYGGLVATFCERTEQLELSRLELDRIAGLPSGYAGKILSKEPVKTIGLNSLGPVLQSLGLVLCVLEDPAARDRTLARREPFKANNRRVGNHCNPKKPADSGASTSQERFTGESGGDQAAQHRADFTIASASNSAAQQGREVGRGALSCVPVCR